ncbi:glutathione S-transferase family protein [Paracoccus sp. MBLB3053]|uniref:Glutathione S-transferase family protein n=1 Tax=Paracoccus aurantius TaxID=3073814 RepID=A0ABU2HPP6_9RHOB|nr:glutathione S-transferase family protein [Paracoccus sp. MBLB3053]MDS9467017.1 glutathione S-transferase family protein [Paracoccus sp. MBLB3053]
MLTIYGHPLSSYSQKVLIALYEIGVPFTFRQVDLGDEADREVMASIEPMGLMPGLKDTARGVILSQSSVIIEYVDLHYPGELRLLPEEPDLTLFVRQWDRFFDFQIMQVTQRLVDARLFMEKATEEPIAIFARERLERAYAALDHHLRDREWVAEQFGLADCAAAPSLFYAGILNPFHGYPALSAYFERLLARPSFHRARTEALPCLKYFPFPELIPARFLT